MNSKNRKITYIILFILSSILILAFYYIHSYPSVHHSSQDEITYHDTPVEIERITVYEWYPEDSIKVSLIKVIDGDTIEVSIDNVVERVRLVGYNAYELNENKGIEAKKFLENLLKNKEIFLKIDSLEPRDKYNRILGYIWFKNNGNYCMLNKYMILDNKNFIKNLIKIEPDEISYDKYFEYKEIKFNKVYNITLYNCSGKFNFISDSLFLNYGYYLIEFQNNSRSLIFVG